jgi:DNA-binding transcriptional MerR regulator
MTNSGTVQKSADAFRTISEVADALKLPQHVLRFWETRFVQIKPLKRGGGRRFYRPEDVELLAAIRKLLYGEGYTIRGVQRILKEQGPRAVAALARGQGADTARLHQPADPSDEADAPSPDEIEARVEHALPAEDDDLAFEQGMEFTRRSDAEVAEEPAGAQGSELPVNPDFSSRRGPGRPEAPSYRAGPAAPIEAANQLRAVLAELAECRRILAAARG